MKKKKGKKIIVLIIIVVLIVVILKACGGSGDAVLNIVETVTPHNGDIEEIVNVSGVIESKEIKNYFAEVNGKVSEVSVEAGDVVEAGDTLILYDMDAMEEFLEQARLQYISSDSTYNNSLADNKDALSKLKEAETNLKVLNQQIKDEEAYIKALRNSLESIQTSNANSLAEQNLYFEKQMIELQKDPIKNADAISNIQIQMQTNAYLSQIAGSSDEEKKIRETIEVEEEKLADYEKHRAEMESQKQQAEATVLNDYQKENLSATGQLNLMTYESAQKDYETAKAGVTAAFDGIITAVSAIEGMPVGEGAQLVTLASSNDIKVVLSVGKYDLRRIALGQTAKIDVNNHLYSGTVTKIDKMAVTGQTGGAQVRIEVSIENPDDNIYLGIEAKVEILTDAKENTLLIPVEAVNADKQGDFVYVEENGIAIRKNIVCGISNVEYTEVLEGLTVNDKIIVSSLQTIEEGMAVMNMPESAMTE